MHNQITAIKDALATGDPFYVVPVEVDGKKEVQIAFPVAEVDLDSKCKCIYCNVQVGYKDDYCCPPCRVKLQAKMALETFEDLSLKFGTSTTRADIKQTAQKYLLKKTVNIRRGDGTLMDIEGK